MNETLLQSHAEIPLWSAPFGLALLERVLLKPGMILLDVGCGTGFPLIELAQRLGTSGRVYGLDPSVGAVAQARERINALKIGNATVIEGRAEMMPFSESFFDSIVSNNGINNVGEQHRALGECHRVLKADGQLVVTMNLPDTMEEFYRIFDETLYGLGLHNEITRMREHIFAKRKSLSFITSLLHDHGFRIMEVDEESFTMRFLDGTALFGHSLIRSAFLGPWREIVEENKADEVLAIVEQRLNLLSRERGELRLTIPFACFDCRKR